MGAKDRIYHMLVSYCKQGLAVLDKYIAYFKLSLSSLNL
jgi:hypothetical protein